MLVRPQLFKAYDIRGEWGTDWDEASVYRIGQALVHAFQPKVVAIGRDMRQSSNCIFHQLSSALLSAGVHVKDLSLCGTELTYFASSYLKDVDISIMITASHNLGKDNGLKITKRGSLSLGLDSGLSTIRDLFFSNIVFPLSATKGSLVSLDIWKQYKDHVFSLASFNVSALSRLQGKKIVIDAGNGMGGYLFDKVLSDLPLDIVRMYWEPDGSFPHHAADPFQEKNTAALQKRVLKEGAMLGVALDGDADRVFFIDDKGRYIPGYYFAALMTKHMLEHCTSPEKEVIVHDPRYFLATREIIQQFGATPLISRVGHTLIKAAMRKHHSLFSAECSGHVFYRENNFAESSMATILQVLGFILEQGPLSPIVDYFFEHYPISGEINFIVQDVEAVLKRVEGTYAAGEITTIDGLSAAFRDWRFNIRPSNTQPLLRLNVEARTKEQVSAKVSELQALIGGIVADH